MRESNIAIANLNLRMSLTANLTNRFENLGHAAAIARVVVAQSPAIRVEGQFADAGNQIAVRDELPALPFFAKTKIFERFQHCNSEGIIDGGVFNIGGGEPG